MARVADILRHPIKGIGSERIPATDLFENRPLPFDRGWAVLQSGQRDTGTWQPRRNFVQVARGPMLATIRATLTAGQITLSAPNRPALTLDLDGNGTALIDWLAPLWPADMPPPLGLIRAHDHGLSDADFPSVSIMNMASLAALSEKTGQPLDQRRFRGNLWCDDLPAWEELNWVGKTLRIGTAEATVVERIHRCRATQANPETGKRDANTLGMLNAHWGHQDFGVNARVTKPGRVALGDKIEVL